MDQSLSQLCETVRAASEARTPLLIRAGGTKDFYGNSSEGAPLDPRSVAGVVDYEPTELVITARAGTSLPELEQLLAENGQMFAFEPPHFGANATIGGCIAAPNTAACVSPVAMFDFPSCRDSDGSSTESAVRDRACRF